MHGTMRPAEAPRPLRRHRDSWTLREHEVLIEHWPDIATIAKILPHRSRASVRRFASKCNLIEQGFVWSEAQTRLLRRRVSENIPARAIAEEMGLRKLQVVNRMRYLGLQFKPRPPRPTGNKLMDAIYTRAFELNMSRREIDEACGSGGQFRRWSSVRRIAFKHLVKAVRVMDGQLTIEWSNARD